MKKHSIFLILALVSMLFVGCKYDFIMPEVIPDDGNGGNNNGEPISFATQIAPIFSTGDKCTSCHKPGGLGSPDLSNPTTLYSKIVPALVNTASPETSKIYAIPKSGTHYAKTTTAESKLILTWIKEGAKNN